MALSEAEIQGIAARFALPENAIHGTQIVRQAARDTDQWIADNQAGYNAALPELFRSNATLQQKTLVFAFVALRRAGLV